MKNLKILASAATVAVATIFAVSGTAFAGSPGQLAGGDNYVVKNLTKGGAYSNSISAVCGDSVQYSMQISNTHFGALNNVTIKASLPTNGGTSTAVVTTDLGGQSGTTDTASVSLPANAKQVLVNGSTVLYDGDGKAIKTLPNTITSGVNIGTLAGSTTEFVNFKVKVDCPEVPPVVSTGECKAVNIKLGDNRKVTVTITSAVNNATIIGYKTDFGDGTVANTQEANHTYAKDGTYKIVSSVNVKYADGKTEWKTADGCTKNVTFSPKEEPKVTPVTPTELPKTGAGSIVAIFGSVVVLSAIAYNVISRRFGSQS